MKCLHLRKLLPHGVFVSCSCPDGDKGQLSSIWRTQTELIFKLLHEVITVRHRKQQALRTELRRHLQHSKRSLDREVQMSTLWLCNKHIRALILNDQPVSPVVGAFDVVKIIQVIVGSH